MSLRIGTVEMVAETRCEVGESPRWHTDANRLFFVDITAGIVHEYDPLEGTSQPLSRGNTTGGLTIQEDGSLLLFQDRRISVLGLDGVQHEVASGLCSENERFNEVTADPEGRVYAGAMGGNGRLFRFDLDGRVTELLDGLGIPNGMGFTPDLKSMYFTDSTPRRIYKFDYKQETGEITNRRLFAEIHENEGLPDGMTVDAEGYVWTAIWFGGRIKRYAPDGRLDCEVLLPVKQPTAVAFGGPKLEDLFLTTAATDTADSLSPPGYDTTGARGGGLYRVHVDGVLGKPLFRSRLSFPLQTSP
jgi:D-xylono/L-arabinono-1,4-lactonase